ncbi:MAG: CinA family protein [Nitratireductor sp.]
MKIDPELNEISQYVLAKMNEAGLKVATAESCTGGLVSALLSSIAGSSSVFERGFVTYSNEAKCEQLGVDNELIDEFGAVSSQVAMAMAAGALDNSNANISVSITGIAGPDGGSEEKPVGLVYIAIAGPEGMFVEELKFGNLGRHEIRSQSAIAALEMLVAFGLSDDEEDEAGSVH